MRPQIPGLRRSGEIRRIFVVDETRDKQGRMEKGENSLHFFNNKSIRRGFIVILRICNQVVNQVKERTQSLPLKMPSRWT